MSFDVPKVENYKFYLDVAFNNARKKASEKRSSLKMDRFSKSKVLEFEKIETVNDVLTSKLAKIIISFPNFDNLVEFYTELVSTLIDYKELKKSLGALNWAKKKIPEFSRQFKTSIRKTQDLQSIRRYGKEYYGRISSVMRQIRSNLEFLEETRKIMRNFPTIKEMFTVAIAGFPNVGKSTLLSKLTTSKPDIQSYAFTTTTLNVGYIKENTVKIQFIDTPGTLNRISKMNEIEQIAYLAIKYCANMIIYVYDLSEHYTLKDQEQLLENLKEFDKPIVLYLSKTDILDKKKVAAFKKKVQAITDITILKEKVLEGFKKY
ncbi:50S ribosome-binding GTPase [Candidatus Woesearchaeota archaeon]|nr:50S ribosome-binding GTPase [Candidatus Woesearchaeota archaeon]